MLTNDTLKKLEKILALEAQKDYNDTAVMGGLEKFVVRWMNDAAGQLGDRAIELRRLFGDYASLAPDERRQRIAQAQMLLAATQPETPAPPTRTAAPRNTKTKTAQTVIEPKNTTKTTKPVIDRKEEPTPIPPAHDDLDFLHGMDEVSGHADDFNPQPVVVIAPEPEKKRARFQPGTVKKTPGRNKEGITLDSPVTFVRGISTGYAIKLQKLGVETIRDLLWLFPHRYNDYSSLKPIRSLSPGQIESVRVEVVKIENTPTRSGRPMTKAIMRDEWNRLDVIWWGQQHLDRRITPGTKLVLSGKVEMSMGRVQMSGPDWEIFDDEEGELTHTGRLVPVYPLTEGLGNGRWLRSVIKGAVEQWADHLDAIDHLPRALRLKNGLPDLGTAVRQMHFPDNPDRQEKAQRRLAFDEFLLIQLGMLMRKKEWQEGQPGNSIPVDHALLDQFLQSLPFTLTNAQRRSLDDVLRDMERPIPMTRLIQGDVGSGKTVVAAIAMMMAVQAGYQAAIMAPTEILAEQHARNLARIYEQFRAAYPAAPELNVALLKGSLKKSERTAANKRIAEGEVQVVVGTHAVIQQDVQFQKLGLTIVDEQHRFGVEQRAALREKGYNPDMLVMTATPIPRTLALTLYGDLDLSVIDELPPGRQEIVTRAAGPEARDRAYEFVRKEVNEGHQVFIICPLVEESEKLEAKAAVEEYERLRSEIFPDLRLGLLHGRMKASEKDAVMVQFRDHQLDILVSTAVVEVGIDIPNATLMLIEGAERFGLAQLHQFRGRVGRGSAKSYCILLSESDGGQIERLQVMVRTNNGFVLAEEDLRLRGPGEFFGTRQSGMPDLHVAKLSDSILLEQARNAALELYAIDKDLSQPEHERLRERVANFWKNAEMN